MQLIAEVRDPETRKYCRVWWNLARSVFVYAIDDGVIEPVPTDIPTSHPSVWIAMELLRRHINAGQPCDAEELTLP